VGKRLVVEQHVQADPSRVFAAWTSAEGLATWWWPHLLDTTYEVDSVVGGRYEIRAEFAGFGACGQFLELDEPNRIRMTWSWMNDLAGEPEDFGDRVTVTFTEVDGGTRLVLEHNLPDIAGEGEDIRHGWQDVLGRLAAVCGTA